MSKMQYNLQVWPMLFCSLLVLCSALAEVDVQTKLTSIRLLAIISFHLISLSDSSYLPPSMRGYHHAGQPRLPKNNPISKQRLIIRKDYYFVRVLHRQLLYPSSTLGWVVLYLPDRQYNNLLRFAIAVLKKFQVQTLRVRGS